MNIIYVFIQSFILFILHLYIIGVYMRSGRWKEAMEAIK